jgi:hypothetical protein
MTRQKGWLWGISFSALTYVCGPLAPTIQDAFNRSPELYFNLYVNAVWDCLYGIGFEIAYFIVGDITLNRFAGTLGVIVWPTFLFWTMAYLVKRCCSAKWSGRWRAGIAIFFIATLFLYVPMSSLGKSGWPSFSADFFVTY